MDLSNAFNRLTLATVVLIICVMGAVLTVSVYRTAYIKQQAFKSLVNKSFKHAEIEFRKFFELIISNLRVAQRWGASGVLQIENTQALNVHFIPILEELPYVSGLVIANTQGQEYLLLRKDNNWQSRTISEAGREAGVKVQAHWQLWQAPDVLLREWQEEFAYDPRQRPWFEGAVAAQDSATPFWSEPYLFFDSQKPGITVSLRWESVSDSYVVALDVLLIDLSSFTMTLKPGEYGLVTLLSDAGGVIGLPNDERFQDRAIAEAALLTPAAEFQVTVLAAAVQAWEKQGVELNEPFSFTEKGKIWWAGFRPVSVGNLNVWTGIMLPEHAFSAALEANRNIVLLTIAGIALVAILVTVALSRWHHHAMRQLVTNNVASIQVVGDSDGDDKDESTVLSLVQQGEGPNLEFKSTLRWNLNKNRAGKEVEIAWLKTVVAFLNTEGGMLLVGVDDQGQILGIDADQFPSEDKYLLHVNNLVNQHIGAEYSQFIKFRLLPVSGQQVLLIECERCDTPAFLIVGKQEEFYIRSGPGSRKLLPSKTLRYLESRKQQIGTNAK